MIDLNHIFLFVAVVSPLVILARAWRPGGPYRGWRIAALVVLVLTGTAWLLFSHKSRIYRRGRLVRAFVSAGNWIAPRRGFGRAASICGGEKLATGLNILHPSEQLRHQVQLLRRFESGETAGFAQLPMESAPAPDRRRLRDAPAVHIFILLNVVAFLFEISHRRLARPGASSPRRARTILCSFEITNTGASSPRFSALRVVHLLFNLFALYVLGVPLERSIGSIRFCFCYLIAGLGSSAGVVALALDSV